MNFDFGKLLSLLTKEELEDLWTKLNSYATGAVANILAKPNDPPPEDLLVVIGVVQVACLCFSLAGMSNQVPTGLMHTAVLLHSVLPNIQNENVSNVISLMCEAWYTAGLDGKDALMPNTLLFLLKRTQADGADKTDWIMRNSFN